jgi:hypothetical protein
MRISKAWIEASDEVERFVGGSVGDDKAKPRPTSRRLIGLLLLIRCALLLKYRFRFSVYKP